MKPTKSGVVSALNHIGFFQDGLFPPSLKSVKPAESFTAEELSFAKYLQYDTDFGGAWDDEEQINRHCS